MVNSFNKKKCVVAVDAMGGDFAPQNELLGSLDALKESADFELLLVGNKSKVLQTAQQLNIVLSENMIVHADDVVEMNESPINAIKSKPNSSLVVGAKLVRDGKADAFVSAGNTGAMLAVSTLIIGRIPGVGRPTIGASFPTETGKVCLVFDAGASVDSKATHLFEYAVMGTIFSKEIYGVKNPSVGLLNVGEEESKGNEVSLTAYSLLKKSNLNFVGNVEGRDILKGKTDIVVCDGFVGNILLKFGESFIGFLKTKIRKYANANLVNKLKALVVKNVFKSALADIDYQTYGGVPLLGVNGISIIGHGSSSPLAIKNMVFRAKEMYEKNLIQKMEDALKNYASGK
ncbi:phosphate acyltransferase PlsX [Melioribacteraceae bacterium 4301-Me]|uniref:phosphate acyltransferase PlsX n=1 Tax=Pyranulibacter aquaticus TaxID=3163344 RepID=UPI00359752EF